MKIAIPVRNNLSVLFIQILGAAVSLDSREVVDMAAADEMATVGMATVIKECV
jgi:hypothetical protein